MKPAAPDDDATVKIVPTRPSRASRGALGLIIAGAFILGLGAATVGWFLWPHATSSVTQSKIAATAPQPNTSAAPAADEFPIETATEAEIRDHVSTGMTVFRLAANPNVLILDFASLLDQGLMLNRIGAFAEKTGVPHDRILNDAELDQAVRRDGDTTETFYYGHDYSAATIARFFALADRDHIALNVQEEKLRRLMRQEGWFAEGKSGGLISVPRAGSDERVTPDARATILHHELSHGEYFSNPAYVEYTHHFWTTVLTQAERDAVRKYLQSEEYDSTLDDLMQNEAQAYLVFTMNPVFFAPSLIGMTEARRLELRSIFLRDVPAPWMRDTVPPQPGYAKAGAH